ncbi:MAG: 4-hydroxy-tetrahydrodipicolinate synthase [Oligoflexia bacterium]|nr:4-hydroxy-tetrahydrodipicolinate synthase [Oligoflexia bacterium]
MLIDASLSGTFPALVTPFTADGRAVDFDSFASLIQIHLKCGVAGVVACGSTGEAATLSDEEYRAVLEAAVAACAGQVPVIAGVNSSSTQRAAAMAREAQALGVDAVLVVAPPYNKPSQAGILAHFAAVRTGLSIPILAYNIPGRAVANILPATVAQLAREKIIVGLKDSSGSIDQFLDTRAALGTTPLAILSGEDSLVHCQMACGGQGVISASANLIPELFVEITTSALKGDWNGALKAQMRALPIVRALFTETNPVPVKAALALRGWIKHPTVRLPLLGASASTIDLLGRVLG